MKKLILFFLFLFASNLYAQQYLAAAKIDGPWGGAWGYIDTTGKWAIKPIYQEASAFSEGYAKVKYSGLYGFIDKKGNWIAKPIYPEAQDFSNGIAKVLFDGWGFIDTTGAVFLKTKYAYADYFSSGYAKVKRNLQWYFVDSNGVELKTTVDYKSFEPFHEGLARVQVDGKWGYMDPSGVLVIKAEFQEVGDFSEGLAWVKSNGRIGYIDKKGNFKIQPKYREGKDFLEHKARVFNEGCWSFIDTTGKTLILLDRKIQLVSRFTNGFARVKSGDAGYINTKGEVVVDIKYVIAKDFNKGITVVRDNEYFTLIDTTGKVLLKNYFAALDICDNGYIKAKVLTIKNQCGFIDKNGNWLIKPDFIEVGVFVNVEERNQKGFNHRLSHVPVPFTPGPMGSSYVNDYR